MTLLSFLKFVPQNSDTFGDFTSQSSSMLRGKMPCASGAFGSVYQCTIKSGKGTMEVAVKIFSMAPHAGRDLGKIEKGIRRELEVWLRLRDPTIVPLLGFANVKESLFPALVSEWMLSGTLYEYLERPDTIFTTRVTLAKGVADGLAYLHSNQVIHGDLHPGNVLIDGAGHPRLTDFGLATVAGDKELQWSSTTAGRNFNPRWRAPEVMGISQFNSIVIRPNFKSDVYSFGSVMFFIVSGVMPWNERNALKIIANLGKGMTPARLDNIHDNHWSLINDCWHRDPANRPEAMVVASRLPIENTTIAGETENTTGEAENTIVGETTMGETTIVGPGEITIGKAGSTIQSKFPFPLWFRKLCRSKHLD